MASTVLIIEDHKALRGSLRDWLQTEFADCCWLEAASGEAALTVARRQLPDLVLMDIDLPHWDGAHVMEQVKLVAAQAPVIVLTMHEAPEYRADVDVAGASGYVVWRNVRTDLTPIVQQLLCATGWR